MKRLLSCFALCALVLTGCDTIDPDAAARATMNAQIAQEPAGNYFIGRRMYKDDYKVWGWVRQPGQPWKDAKLVMFNEQQKLAPDRAANKIGTDNNYVYKLTGYFSGDTVYEPASDGFYPEFVLQNYQVIETNPPNIYSYKNQVDPAQRILAPPL